MITARFIFGAGLTFFMLRSSRKRRKKALTMKPSVTHVTTEVQWNNLKTMKRIWPYPWILALAPEGNVAALAASFEPFVEQEGYSFVVVRASDLSRWEGQAFHPSLTIFFTADDSVSVAWGNLGEAAELLRQRAGR